MVSTYFTLAEYKAAIGIAVADTDDDTFLNQSMTETFAETDSTLFPVEPEVPISSPTQQQKNLALAIAKMKWFEYIKSWSSYRTAEKRRDQLKEELIGQNKSEPTDRHTTEAASTDFRSLELTNRYTPQ